MMHILAVLCNDTPPPHANMVDGAVRVGVPDREAGEHEGSHTRLRPLRMQPCRTQSRMRVFSLCKRDANPVPQNLLRWGTVINK